MSAGSGRAFAQLVSGLEGIVALVPRIGRSPQDPPWLHRVLRFSGRAGGPLKLWTILQHAEIVAAPLRFALRRGRPAFVFASQPLFSGVGALLLRRLCGVPYLVMAYGEELTGCAAERTWLRPRWRLLRLTLRHAAGVICTAALTRELAVRLGGIPSDRVHVFLPGVDLNELAHVPPPPPSTAAPRLLMVGRLWQTHKGFDTTIAALPRVLELVPTVELVIAGPGDPSELAAQARRLGVGERVRFVGEVERERLLQLYADCTLFVMPGRAVGGTAEGFGIVYLEAGAFGKPAIAGRAGGAVEAVIDGETGLIVDGEDVTAVADAIVRLLTEPGLAARLGAGARARVLREFDASAQGAEVARVLVAAVPEARELVGHG
jgi:phosphatidylinositol alpha-1,6-mannosyltransferase